MFVRFAAVGLASNAFLFLAYLLLTSVGLDPVLAVTLVWVIGVAITFVFNRSWTFRYTGAVTPALIRYGLLYGVAYALNVLLLLVLVHAGYPHAIVQGVLIVLIAVGLFTVQRLWVFRKVPR